MFGKSSERIRNVIAKKEINIIKYFIHFSDPLENNPISFLPAIEWNALNN